MIIENVAHADDKIFRVLDTCSRLEIGEINYKEAKNILKLKKKKQFEEGKFVDVWGYCKAFNNYK